MLPIPDWFYLLSLVSACLLGLWVVIKAWRNRDGRGGVALVAMAAATVVWSAGTVGLVLATDPAVELRLRQLTYIGMVSAPITFFVLAVQYTGYGQLLTSSTRWSLLSVGGVILGAVWTNPLHNLYWADVEYATSVPAGIETTPAPLFWLFVLFTYGLLLAGSVLFVRYALGAPHLYRNQTTAILVAVGVPWAANIPYVVQVMDADLTPVALSVTAVSLSVAMFRYKLTDLSPVALRSVFESISTGVFVLDGAERVVDINPAGKQMLGVTDEVIGKRPRSVMPDTVYERFDRIEDRSTLAVDGSVVQLDDDVETYYFDIQRTPIDSPRGQGELIVVNDITDQKQQQKRLESQKDRLDEFASVISHDLRNPLNVASGHLELANEDCESEHLDRTAQALDRMETLIEDLLTLAREGDQITDTEPVGLETVCAAAWDTVDTDTASLENQVVGRIRADRSRLQQLFENLIRNAVEHGGDSVTVGTQDDGFYIADDGPGIPPADRETVFETGYSTSETGTGFGLRIVQQIVEAHGWEIQVTESSAGGARFEITGVAFVD